MINVIAIFLMLIFLLLVTIMVGAFLAWQKVSIFLTWNTRYESQAYEQAITTPKKIPKPVTAIKTENKGRVVKEVDDLVDITDLPFEVAFKAIEEASDGA